MATAAGSEAASSGPDPGNRGSSDLGCAPAAATSAPTRPSSAWGTDPRGPGVPRLGERRLSLGHPTERSRSTWGSLVQCQTRALEEVGTFSPSLQTTLERVPFVLRDLEEKNLF